MKLVIATPLYPPEIGGPATYAKMLTEELPKRGVDVLLIRFAEVRGLPKLLRHYVYYRKVRAAAMDADAILALDPVSVGWPAMRASKQTGKPLLIKIVGDYAWEQGRQRFAVAESLDAFVKNTRVPLAVSLLRHIQTAVAFSARRIIVPSHYLKGIVASWGIPQEKIEVIYNAFDIDNVGQVPPLVQSLPRPLVVSVGRLVPWKHLDGLIDAALPAKVSLVIVGDGPLREALEEEMQRTLGDHGLCTGSLSHADTLAVMNYGDVFVLNSSYEGLSHVLMEALALGKAIIATDAGGNTELIDGKNGLLISPGDAEALREALARVSSDEGLQGRLAIAAKESSQRFSRTTMIESTLTLLKTL